MKGLTCHGPGRRSWEDVSDPAVKDPSDAIVRADDVAAAVAGLTDGLGADTLVQAVAVPETFESPQGDMVVMHCPPVREAWRSP